MWLIVRKPLVPVSVDLKTFIVSRSLFISATVMIQQTEELVDFCLFTVK